MVKRHLRDRQTDRQTRDYSCLSEYKVQSSKVTNIKKYQQQYGHSILFLFVKKYRVNRHSWGHIWGTQNGILTQWE